MEITLCHGCSPVNLLHIFRTPFQKNTFGGLLLFDNRVIKNDIYMILPFICRKPIVLSFRSSHRRCSLKKGVLKNFAKVTGKHLWQSLFFNKGVFAQVFSCEFCQLFKKTFLQNTSRRLLRKHIENCYIKRHHVYFNLL